MILFRHGAAGKLKYRFRSYSCDRFCI